MGRGVMDGVALGGAAVAIGIAGAGAMPEIT